MTTNEAARRLGCTRQWIDGLIADGRIKAVKMGRNWWIEDADLPASLAAIPHKPMGRPPTHPAATRAALQE